MTFFAKFIFLLILAGITFASYSAWEEMERAKRIESEVEKLRAEAMRVQDENKTLSERIAYLGTDAYQEREAKEKLGLKNADESAAIVRPDKKILEESPDSPLPASSRRVEQPIFKKWIYFFFPSRYNE